MGLDDALCDVETEAGPPAAATAPELGEDAADRLGRDAVTLVGNRHFGTVVIWADGDGDGAAAVADRVLDEVADHLRQLVGVDPHLRQTAGGVEPEAFGRLARSDARVEVALNDRGNVHYLLAQLEAAGLDPRDVQELTDKPGDTVGVRVDRLQHELLLVVGEPVPLCQQGRGEALDARQR